MRRRRIRLSTAWDNDNVRGSEDNNATSQSTEYSDPAGLGTLAACDSGSHAPFLGEFGLQCSYQLAKHGVVHGGYYLMLIDGIAVAPPQGSNTDLGAGIAAIDGERALQSRGRCRVGTHLVMNEQVVGDRMPAS